MTKPSDEVGAQRWRSRAFAHPLLVTLAGVAGPPAALFVWRSLFVPPDPCPSCGPGYGIGMAIIYGLIFLAVWCAAMLTTGFLVGRSSRDSRLAFRAILVAAAGLALTVSIIVTSTSQVSVSFLDAASAGLGIALWTLIPTALGFGVGRSMRPRLKEG